MTVVVAGGGTALESLLLGAKAWMTGLVNFLPKISVTMFQLAVLEKRYEEARKIYFEKVLPVHSCMKEVGKPVPTVKYALEILGFPVGNARKPLQPLSDTEKRQVQGVLQQIGVLRG